MKETLQVNERQILQAPTEGKWFRINVRTIDQTLFNEARSDSNQEKTRQLILEAFEEVKKSPKYVKSFKILIPRKNWSSKNVRACKRFAQRKFRGSIATWVDQALVWAKRISDGESWEMVCNSKDTANWYRLIKWKDGTIHPVGGMNVRWDNRPSSFIHDCTYGNTYPVHYCVPLIVKYKFT